MSEERSKPLEYATPAPLRRGGLIAPAFVAHMLASYGTALTMLGWSVAVWRVSPAELDSVVLGLVLGAPLFVPLFAADILWDVAVSHRRPPLLPLTTAALYVGLFTLTFIWARRRAARIATQKKY